VAVYADAASAHHSASRTAPSLIGAVLIGEVMRTARVGVYGHSYSGLAADGLLASGRRQLHEQLPHRRPAGQQHRHQHCVGNGGLGRVGNGTAQPMTTDSTATQSYWDGYTYCQRARPALHRRLLSHHRRCDRRGAGDRHRAGGADRRCRRHHSLFKNPLDVEAATEIPAPSLSRQAASSTAACRTWFDEQQHLERELLDVLLFEQFRAAGRHVHRRGPLHAEYAMIAHRRPRCGRLFFWLKHSA